MDELYFNKKTVNELFESNNITHGYAFYYAPGKGIYITYYKPRMEYPSGEYIPYLPDKYDNYYSPPRINSYWKPHVFVKAKCRWYNKKKVFHINQE